MPEMQFDRFKRKSFLHCDYLQRITQLAHRGLNDSIQISWMGNYLPQEQTYSQAEYL